MGSKRTKIINVVLYYLDRKRIFMKKKIIASLLCIGMMGMIATGCGKDDGKSTGGSADIKKLAPYEGIEVYKSNTEVSEDEIKQQLTYAAQQHSTKDNVKEGTVKDGDVVNIDYVGKLDGKEFEN